MLLDLYGTRLWVGSCRPYGNVQFISFLFSLCSFLSLCLRCTTSDEVVTLTHTRVIWDSRARVPNQPF